MNAEVNSGNNSTCIKQHSTLLRIRECRAGMKCDLKVKKHYYCIWLSLDSTFGHLHRENCPESPRNLAVKAIK